MNADDRVFMDMDVSSFYPFSASVIVKAPPYRYKRHNDYCWRIYAGEKVHAWISETLPDTLEYQGDVFLNEKEFMMLVLRFGVGVEKT